ncbi:hypothetical protein [Kineococcus arenarius]|uniref:hypothetical protein n=1 Tax=Kineococcus sp. SYSU DK007 TaxID=3383128 RepID=UPI003D7D7834
MSPNLDLHVNIAVTADPSSQDPVAFGQWLHSAVSTFTALQAESAHTRDAATVLVKPVSSSVHGLPPQYLKRLDGPAMDVINRWQAYDRNNSGPRLRLLQAVLDTSCAFMAPRARNGEPSKRPYLNLAPMQGVSSSEYAGSMNSGRVFFTNARHLVDTTHPLVDTSGTYPAVDLFKAGAHDFVVDVLTRYVDECYDRWDVDGVPISTDGTDNTDVPDELP